MKKKSVKSYNPCIFVIQTSYDIITKGHGGRLELATEVGAGSKFIIEIPLTT